MQRERLANDLEVVVVPRRAAPLVTVSLTVGAGAVDELDPENGLAHLLEHMLFKGSARYGVGEAAAAIDDLGGDLNAYTSHDATTVHATAPTHGFGVALDVVSDLITGPRFEAEALRTEREVVLEEVRSYLDDPDSLLDDAVMAALMGGHPYARPIAGTLSTVGALEVDHLRRFWEAHYGADRAQLVVVGDVDAGEAIAAARERLGAWRRAGRRRAAPGSPLAPAAQAVLRPPGRYFSPLGRLSWRLPAAGHPDHPALAVLATGLAGTGSALLVDRLDHDRGWVHAIEADSIGLRWAGSFDLTFAPREGRVREVIKECVAQIEAVARRGLGGAGVGRARDALLADALFESETTDGLAETLTQDLNLHGDPDFNRRFLRDVNAVTDADLRRVAGAWLRFDAAVLALAEPKSSRFGAEVLMPPARPRSLPSGPSRHVLDNGATVLLLPDDAPVAAAHLVALGGRHAEPAGRAGLAQGWERTALLGTAHTDVADFEAALDDAGAVIEPSASRNAIQIAASCPAHNLEDTLALLGEAICTPRFDADDWSRTRDELREEIAQGADRPDARLQDLLWGALWPEHPWGAPALGTPETLARIEAGALRRWHRAQLHANNVALAVAGGFDPEDALAWCREALRGLPRATGPTSPPPAPAPVRAGEHRAQAGREQVWVALGARGPRLHDPDRVAFELGLGVLSGHSGRLFRSLREERGLAYDVFAASSLGWWGGIVQIGMVTSPSQAEAALAGLSSEVERLCARGPTFEELERVKKTTLGSTAMALQRAAGRAADAASHERAGLLGGLQGVAARIDAVQLDQVREALQRWLSAPPVRAVVEPVR